MENYTALFRTLGLINSCIFERINKGQFKSLYVLETWLTTLVPEACKPNVAKVNTFEYQGSCAYLNDFLLDAEEFWINAQEGEIQSGIWREQIAKQDLYLEARAIIIQGSCYLLISDVKKEYQRQQQTLQVARELLLSNDKIVAQHDHVFNRLESILANSIEVNKPDGPLQLALHKSELGIAILDEQMNLLTSNNALYQMFDIAHHKSKKSPETILLQLFENQYPEYQRVLSTKSSWSGELYWLNPTTRGSWFKMSIHPICHSEKQLTFWLLSISDISQLKYLQKRNEKLSHFDLLTELPNRQNFCSQLVQQIKKGLPFYLLYIEIKQFKKINELHGHLVGDNVIRELSLRLRATINSEDILARIGGTEFALIIHNDGSVDPTSYLNHQICEPLSNELISAINQPYYTEQGHQCEVGLNIGAVMYPIDADIAEDLMKYADLAMFEAKKQPKSSLQFYSKALKDASQQRIELENSLRCALENGEFELYFQPMFDLQTDKIVKAEALIRWNRPLIGIISPDDFIPMAEQTGLIVAIGKWVIKETCAKLAILQANNLTIKLCINLSPRQINDRQLLDFIINCIDVFAISPKLLELELTEGILVDNFIKVQHLLNAVRKLGITVSIDDFGTGYSSLSYLQKLPIDQLKIDRSFIEDLHDNENDRALVLAIIAMAHSLKLGVIAEGVETIQQKEFLQFHNSNIVQGFLFSHPVPFEQLMSMLGAQKELAN
jgi:diguanylate cyclase (GGDEF)-like protein